MAMAAANINRKRRGNRTPVDMDSGGCSLSVFLLGRLARSAVTRLRIRGVLGGRSSATGPTSLRSGDLWRRGAALVQRGGGERHDGLEDRVVLLFFQLASLGFDFLVEAEELQGGLPA